MTKFVLTEVHVEWLKKHLAYEAIDTFTEILQGQEVIGPLYWTRDEAVDFIGEALDAVGTPEAGALGSDEDAVEALVDDLCHLSFDHTCAQVIEALQGYATAVVNRALAKKKKT